MREDVQLSLSPGISGSSTASPANPIIRIAPIRPPTLATNQSAAKIAIQPLNAAKLTDQSAAKLNHWVCQSGVVKRISATGSVMNVQSGLTSLVGGAMSVQSQTPIVGVQSLPSVVLSDGRTIRPVTTTAPVSMATVPTATVQSLNPTYIIVSNQPRTQVTQSDDS